MKILKKMKTTVPPYNKEKGKQSLLNFLVNIYRVLYDPNQPRDEKGRWIGTGGKNFMARAMASGGFTFRPVTGSPTTGCMVSLDSKEGFEKSVKLPADKAKMLKLLTEEYKKHVKKCIPKMRENPDLYVGGWVEDGKFCFDLSENVKTGIKNAVELAKKRRQRGFYDIDNNIVIEEKDYDKYLKD